jgi:hypothetical protein
MLLNRRAGSSITSWLSVVTRFGNLLFAVGLSFMMYAELTGPQVAWTVDTIIGVIVAPLWLIGALGLYWQDRMSWCSGLRMAWCASALGVGTMFASSVVMIGVASMLAPVATDPSDGVGYAMIAGLFGVGLSICILVGLLRIRLALVRKKILKSLTR